MRLSRGIYAIQGLADELLTVTQEDAILSYSVAVAAIEAIDARRSLGLLTLASAYFRARLPNCFIKFEAWRLEEWWLDLVNDHAIIQAPRLHTAKHRCGKGV